MTSTRFFLLATGAACALSLAACGGDDGDGDTAPPPTGDMGSDAGTDMGEVDMGGTGFDLGGADMGGIRIGSPCDPWNPSSCAGGVDSMGGPLKCSVVLGNVGIDAGATGITVGYACVPAAGSLPEGSVCPGFRTFEGGAPSDRADPCEQGSFCWDTPGRLFRSCQKMCGETMVRGAGGCGMPDQFCLLLNGMPLFGTCTTASGCDPVFQTGCRPGQACLVEFNDEGEQVGHCFDVPVDPDAGIPRAPGERCMGSTECGAGSTCLRDRLPDGGLTMEAFCRSFCEFGGMGDGDEDAGAEDAGTHDAGGDSSDGGAHDAGGEPTDGGTPTDGGAHDAGSPFTGRCPTGAMCQEFPIFRTDGGTGTRLPTPVGFCR
jgi:hypothetical protein